MANEQNLRPAEYKLTLEEQKKGGIASGEARRRRKQLREQLEALLDETNHKTGKSFQHSISLGIIANAIDKTKGGNPEAYKLIAKMLKQYEDKEMGAETKEPVLNITIVNNDDLKEEFYKEQ